MPVKLKRFWLDLFEHQQRPLAVANRPAQHDELVLEQRLAFKQAFCRTGVGQQWACHRHEPGENQAAEVGSPHPSQGRV